MYDAKKFALYNRPVIEQAPLQLYCAALIFAPENSIVRRQFEKYIPAWIQKNSKAQAKWIATLQTLEGHWSDVNSVTFSPDGKVIASASRDRTARLWDAVTGAALQTLESHSSDVNSVAFSPDGKMVASASDDSTVRLSDAVTGATLQKLEGHSYPVKSVAFSPDGKVVASASGDSTVRLWDTVMGAALQTLEGHSYGVNSVAFSPDGKMVASASDDSTVRLWDTVARSALLKLELDISTETLSFSSSGQYLKIDNGLIRVSPLSTFSGFPGQSCGLAVIQDWPEENGKNILWLPTDYRATCVAVWKELVVLGHSSGGVSIPQFSRGSKMV